MRRSLRWRGIVIALVFGICLSVGIYPLVASGFGVRSPSWLLAKELKLGLDLRGGVHLVLRVRTDGGPPRRDGDGGGAAARCTAKERRIAPGRMSALDATHFAVAGLPPDADTAFRDVAAEVSMSFDRTAGVNGAYMFAMKPAVQTALRADAIAQTHEAIERRVNELGVSEASISSQGANGDELLVQLPGVSDIDRARAIIQSRGRLEFKIVEQGPAPSPEALAPGKAIPDGMEIVAGGANDSGLGSLEYYLVKTAAAVTGRDLRTARSSLDDTGRPAVMFTLTGAGGRAFGRLTSENIGRQLAIILDGQLQSAARIENTITTTGRIAGSFTEQETENLALILRAGALPTGLDYLEQSTIGPSLGADAVRAGVLASSVGLLAILGFMLAFYRWSGVNAAVALVFNLVMLLGLMAYIGVVMTLPGIAGFVLTMGIGVDSNVLIFERIKEELAAQRSVRASVSAGFSRVFRTLLDTHISGLIAAACLFQFGTGAIRGFAVTLTIGLLSNLFTSTFVSRWLFDVVLARQPRVEHLSI